LCFLIECIEEIIITKGTIHNLSMFNINVLVIIYIIKKPNIKLCYAISKKSLIMQLLYVCHHYLFFITWFSLHTRIIFKTFFHNYIIHVNFTCFIAMNFIFIFKGLIPLVIFTRILPRKWRRINNLLSYHKWLQISQYSNCKTITKQEWKNHTNKRFKIRGLQFNTQKIN